MIFSVLWPDASPWKLFAIPSIMLASLPVWADDQPGITPYRPSVSFPAQLSAPGLLELELGVLNIKTDGTLRESLPFDLKLGLSSEWGIRISGEAYVSDLDGSGTRVSGIGDTGVVLKREFLIDDKTALGLELGGSTPHSSATTAGSGKTDYTVNGIVSTDFGAVHWDSNLYFTRLGAFAPGTAHTQTGWTAAFSAPIAGKWAGIAEISGTRRDGAPSTTQLLLSANYSPNKRMTIDFGASKGLTRASQDWSFFSGIVVPVAKLW